MPFSFMGAKKSNDNKVAQTVQPKLGVAEEDDCDCFADAHTRKSCPPICKVTHPLRYYEFTQEEIRALEECDRESFYFRCLPLSTLFATATYMAVKTGYLKRNPHFGVYPKLMVAAFLGYVCGRVSYLRHCDEKLRKLPDNSHLGNVLRKYFVEHNIPPEKPRK